MMPWPGTSQGAAEVPGPTSILGNTTGGAMIVWIATARDRSTDGTASGTINDSATRTAQTCFMRGLKETIQFTSNSPHTWMWRRIAFTLKGDDLITDIAGEIQKVYLETSGGYARYMAQVNTGNATDQLIRDNIVEAIFKGRINQDWLNGYTAKVDTQRVSIKYDRKRMFRSGNDRGSTWILNAWHAMNKNLVYADDEDGGSEDTTAFSTDGKPGMGDYYIIDFIEAAQGASASDGMLFSPQATLYWHEK